VLGRSFSPLHGRFRLKETPQGASPPRTVPQPGWGRTIGAKGGFGSGWVATRAETQKKKRGIREGEGDTRKDNRAKNVSDRIAENKGDQKGGNRQGVYNSKIRSPRVRIVKGF